MKDTQKEEGNSSNWYYNLKTWDNTQQDYNSGENDLDEGVFDDSEPYYNLLFISEFQQGFENSNDNIAEPILPSVGFSQNDDNTTDVNTTMSSNVNQERNRDEIPRAQEDTISEETEEKDRNQRTRKYDTDNMNEKIMTFFLKSLLKYVNQKSKKLYPNKYRFRQPNRKLFLEQKWQKNRQNVLNKTAELYLFLEINEKYTTQEKDINKKTLEKLKKKSNSFKTFVTETLENIYINMFLKENNIDSDGDKMENISDMIEKEKEKHEHAYIEKLTKMARKFIKN